MKSNQQVAIDTLAELIQAHGNWSHQSAYNLIASLIETGEQYAAEPTVEKQTEKPRLLDPLRRVVKMSLVHTKQEAPESFYAALTQLEQLLEGPPVVVDSPRHELQAEQELKALDDVLRSHGIEGPFTTELRISSLKNITGHWVRAERQRDLAEQELKAVDDALWPHKIEGPVTTDLRTNAIKNTTERLRRAIQQRDQAEQELRAIRQLLRGCSSTFPQ